MVVVVVLYFYGGAVLQPFAFTLIIGVIIGTYSSIFVATPILNYTRVNQKTVLRDNIDSN